MIGLGSERLEVLKPFAHFSFRHVIARVFMLVHVGNAPRNPRSAANVFLPMQDPIFEYERLPTL